MPSRLQWAMIAVVTAWFALSGLASGSVAHFIGQGVAGVLVASLGVTLYNYYQRPEVAG